MEWSDDAVVLSVHRHGENAAVTHLLTAGHGRHPGLVPGGRGRALRGTLQPGNRVRAWWQARLPEHLGRYRLELFRADGAAHLTDAGRLAAIAAACAVADAVLPEREPHPAAYAALVALLDALPSEAWPSVYVHWELALLRELGFAVDLSCCAATGSADDLLFVSPKSARAVSRSAGMPYRDRLLPLPGFLVAGGEGDRAQIADGLRLTAFFLDQHVLSPHRRVMPSARLRLVDRFLPSSTIS
jgi:DNA repair protein RecO (recombination protein O)